MIQTVIETKQRLLRRQWLFANLDLLLREVAYHKEHEADELLPGYTLWKLGEALGEYDVATRRP